MRLIFRVLAMVWRAARLATIGRIVLAVLQGALPVATLYTLKLTIDKIANAAQSPHPGLLDVAWLIVALAALGAAAKLTDALAALVSQAQEQAVTAHVQGLIHERAIEVDLAHYENPEYHDTLHGAQREATHRPIEIVNSLQAIGQNVLAAAFLVVLLLSQDWIVAMVLVVAIVPGALVNLRYSQRLFDLYKKNTRIERRWWYLHWILTGGAYAKEVRLFDIGRMVIRRARSLRRVLDSERLRLMRTGMIAGLIFDLPGGVAIVLALTYAVDRTIHGAMTIGALVMYFQTFQRMQADLHGLLGGVLRLYEHGQFIEYLCRFLDLQPNVRNAASPVAFPRPMRGGISFEHVRFAYGNSGRGVFEDLSLSIRAGEHVALVGLNGTGKTTLVKLLCRLYDPVGGRITIDGTDLRDFEVRELRRQIAVVFQDHGRYNFSARENIWLGDVAKSAVDPGVEDAAKASGAHEVLRKLPRGYDTELGIWFDDDEELSVGEWQKVGIARAFFRDAQIVILDEPTSALDAPAEHELSRTLHELCANRTTIVISHRLSVARSCDRICVLADGKIVEHGPHQDLMASGGAYARMFALQSANYER